MYLSQVDRPAGGPVVARAVPGTVVALGAVSFLTDVSSEMVTAFLPLYLVYTLQIGYVQFGLLDGLYTGATAVLRLVGGHLADRFRKPRAVAAVGYGISAATRLGFLAVGASALGIGAMTALDRAGKGLRTAPRDALITLAVPTDRLGTAFGVHRTMDTAGALLGPIVTFLLLVELGTNPQPVFVVSFCFALLGLIVLAGFVPRTIGPSRPVPVAAPREPRPTVRATLALIVDPRLRRAAIVATVLGVATLSDAFLYLLLQQGTGISPGLLPLLPLGTAGVFLLAAVSMGRLADRLGRRRVFLAGHVLLAGAYLLVAEGPGGLPVVIAVLALHGLFYAATDGVLSAWVGEFVPDDLRASGLAAVQTAQAMARFVSSVTTGVLLTIATADVVLGVAVTALSVALITAFVVVRNRRTPSDESAGANAEKGPG